MKRFLGLILALILVFAFTADALAARPSITKQPETSTTNKKGEVSFSVKYSGSGKVAITWYFVNPETGKEVSGRNLSKEVKGVKVSNPNSKKITLKKVPESMHGWMVYCHLNSNGYTVDSDKVMLLCYGLEAPESEAEKAAASADDKGGEDKPEEKPAEEKPAEQAAAEQSPEQGEGEEEEANRTITVTSTAKNLRKLDETGKLVDGDPVSTLEFTNLGSFIVSSDEPIKSWTINGIRYEPAEPVTEFKVLNANSDLTIDLKVAKATAASAQVDESHMCKVTCQGCTFTYVSAGIRNASEGEVPAGAPIRVTADTKENAEAGYSVNGAEVQNAGLSSFQLTVTDDVTIVAGR